jgi:beta-N-acetylhexosaminidase
VAPRSLILGVKGHALAPEERALFREADPWGFILFRRNCANPEQLRALTDELRALTGRGNTPILIDQEGGRVVRMAPPMWRKPPAAAVFGALFETDPEGACEAVWLNARLMAADLSEAGISVCCAPVLDLGRPETSPAIGDRAFSGDISAVEALGRAMRDGLLEGGVLPVLKHIPGHGRTAEDSHHALPRVEAAHDDLARSDFVPFRALADSPMAMTAHIVYPAVDSARPATLSPRVIHGVIRGEIGFDGVLISDDLGMNALSGGVDDRVRLSLAAGCDLALVSNNPLTEMEQAASAAKPLSGEALRRTEAALARLSPPAPFDAAAGLKRLEALLPGIGGMA